MNPNDLQTVLNQDEASLYRQLGMLQGMFATPLADEEYERVGRSWFETQRENLRKLICSNTIVRVLRAGSGFDLLVAVAAAIGQAYQAETAATLAALSVKVGVNTLCMDSSGEKGSKDANS